MNGVSNSSKPRSQSSLHREAYGYESRSRGVSRDRRTTIKPREQAALTSWKSRPVPIWFLRLSFWQRRFGIATYLLIAAMLVAYSSTVYFQQKWHQEFLKLESLQRHERQLTSTNEVLKNQLAAEAEKPATGLMPPNPTEAIILKASNPRSDRPRSGLNAQPQPKVDIPTGY
ncbi:MAG: hypothetical protein KME01_00395 [Chroococcus sp. CMT-3BRIN-NPC107]|jgi:hypothetical protein|nr:hypothetical protein [Chroococcus sp. CMT-3BRIN-NPC107]